MAIKLENKSARILHISLGDGQFVTIPPTESGGVEITFTDDEQTRFDKNLATATVQEWIEAGLLVVGGGGGAGAAPKAEDKQHEAKHGKRPFFSGPEGKGT